MPSSLKHHLLTLTVGWYLAGCSLVPAASDSAPDFPLLSPASYGSTAQFQQTVFLAHGTDEYSLQCAVGVDTQQLTVRAYSALGQRVFAVHLRDGQLQTDVSPMGPQNLPAQRIVGDLQFALWPLAALQTALSGTAWSAEESRPGLRRLRHDGRLYAERHEGLAAAGVQRWWLSNLRHGYSLDITSERVDELH